MFPRGEPRAKSVVRVVTAIAMTVVGISHFTRAEAFEKIVPPWLPAPHALVVISGVAEILGGLGLLVGPMQTFAAWGLVALFVCVFPANIYMATYDVQPFDMHVSRFAQWARLPFQAAFIATAVWLARTPKPK